MTAANSRRGLLLDALILGTLLVLAIAPFIEAVRHPQNIPRGMDFTQHYSRESVMRRALQDTWLPLWNPYEFSGFPLQADIQTGVFYPPGVVMRFFPLASFLTWTVIFHVWMFGVGGYVLCRVLGVGRASAAIGATALMLGGIAIPRVYAGHLDVLRTVAWVPFALAMSIRSVDRGSVWPSALAVLVLSLEVLAGFLQLVCYTFGAIALYSAFSAAWPAFEHRPAHHARTLGFHFVLLVTLVLGLTAFQLLPTARLVLAAGRTHGLPYLSAIESAIHIRQLWQVVFDATPANPIPAESWEGSAYVGWLLAALAPLALLVPGIRQTGSTSPRYTFRAACFFVVLGLLALGLATGGPLYRLHYQLLPMFRIPGRLMVFWAISICAMGAIGLDGLTNAFRSNTGDARGRLRAGLRVLVPLIAGVVIVSDVTSYARHFVRVEPLTDRFPTSVPFTSSAHGRVVSLCETRLQTSELTALGIASVDGYNSYFLGDYAHLSELARGESPSAQLKAFPRMGDSPHPDFAVLNALNVTEIVSCDPRAEPGLELKLQRERFYWYRNTLAFGRVAVRCEDDRHAMSDLSGVCKDDALIEVLTADTPKGRLRFRISSPEARALVLSEPYYPERRAWVDGIPTPVEKANIALSAVRVPAGVHVVELRFVPTSLYWGAAISSTVLVLWLLMSRRR